MALKNIVDFGVRLKEALKRKQMTQSKLSELTGINNSTISEYISGKYEPNRSRISEFAEILNVNEIWLMGYDVPIDRDFNTKKFAEPKNDLISFFRIDTSGLSESETQEIKDELERYTNILKLYIKNKRSQNNKEKPQNNILPENDYSNTYAHTQANAALHGKKKGKK